MEQPQVHQAWAEGILQKGWGIKHCIRIWFRKQRGADYEVTQQDKDNRYARLDWLRSQLTVEDVIGAFSRGEEVSYRNFPGAPNPFHKST